MSTRAELDREFVAALRASQPHRSRLPMAGVENEFYVYCNNRHVDFRALLQQVAAYQSPVWYDLRDDFAQRINSNLADDEINFIDFNNFAS